ncbi:MAG: FkbM family methyltransferase [Flammeovirgaceae bacterium]|nr:FkbM family methyltransferase [Flammeovirgaceae bacterium]
MRNYFDNSKSGFFVEVGANEPVTDFSQSWHLENQLGWTGILIEPNPVLAEKARKTRPNSIIVEAASVSSESVGSLSLFIPIINNEEITGHASIEKNLDNFNYARHREVKVNARTLNSILHEAQVKFIDVLSIDVEGAEMEVLKGFDIEKYKPKLILLEDKHVYLDKHRWLTKKGYFLAKRTTLNCWYIPKGARRPSQTFLEKLRLWKRMYISICQKN